MMKMVTFSELRNNAKKYFDAVERGESVEIYRKGKPVAILSPIVSQFHSRWSTSTPLMLEGVSLSELIIREREEND